MCDTSHIQHVIYSICIFWGDAKHIPEKSIPYFSTLNIFCSPPMSSNFSIPMLFYFVQGKPQIVVEEQTLVNQMLCYSNFFRSVSLPLESFSFFSCLLLFNMNKSFQKLQWKARSILLHSYSKDTASDSSWYMSSIRRESRDVLVFPRVANTLKTSLKVKKK